ncbi:hypothetical protein CFP66_29650 [Pseudonocardia sp. MH-G8]|nr:hypothetical protein CFP66_29650 [Pseudonocardia sp. MH-G8]
MTHAEVEITAELVRDLLRDQHPDLADHRAGLGARGRRRCSPRPACRGARWLFCRIFHDQVDLRGILGRSNPLTSIWS